MHPAKILQKHTHVSAEVNNGYFRLDMAALATGLTPEALMNYCATRLRGIDDQIQEKFVKQQKANSNVKFLADLTEKLQFGNGKIDLNNDGGKECMKNGFIALDDAIAKTDDPTIRAQLSAIKVNLKFMSDKAWDKGDVSIEQIKAQVLDPIGAMQKDVNSGSELDMIKLQSLMSQRQSAVTTVTQMVQALGEQLNKIAGNIGH